MTSQISDLIARDFHTLTSDEVERLLAEADRVKYRKPRNANGSRARYFHAKLQREAERAFVRAFTPNKYGEFE